MGTLFLSGGMVFKAELTLCCSYPRPVIKVLSSVWQFRLRKHYGGHQHNKDKKKNKRTASHTLLSGLIHKAVLFFDQ